MADVKDLSPGSPEIAVKESFGVVATASAYFTTADDSTKKPTVWRGGYKAILSAPPEGYVDAKKSFESILDSPKGAIVCEAHSLVISQTEVAVPGTERAADAANLAVAIENTNRGWPESPLTTSDATCRVITPRAAIPKPVI
jgi:hypothetical protein